MRGGMRVEEAVECGIEIVFGTALKQFADQVGKLLFQKQIFEFAAGFSEAGSDLAEFCGVGGNAFAGGKTVAFHGDREPVKPINPLL